MVTNPSQPLPATVATPPADADLIADALAAFDLAYFSEQRRHAAAEAVLAVLRRATVLAPADQAARRDRYAAAIAQRDGHSWPTEFEDDERDYRRRAVAAIHIADQEQVELCRERDLAIAHDRQPYPTAWAYEQACKALRRKTDAIERTLAFADTLDDTARMAAGPEAVHPVAERIRHYLDTKADEEQQDDDANARLASGLRALMAHDAIEEQPT